MTDFLSIAKQRFVPDIGQFDQATKRALEQAVRRGEIAKWRGCWDTGEEWGTGRPRTCYGPN
jgi:hypothetical protein